MAESSVLYTAGYSDVDAALDDLRAVEKLHKAEMIGKFDAAVVDTEDGGPTSSRAWTAPDSSEQPANLAPLPAAAGSRRY